MAIVRVNLIEAKRNTYKDCQTIPADGEVMTVVVGEFSSALTDGGTCAGVRDGAGGAGATVGGAVGIGATKGSGTDANGIF